MRVAFEKDEVLPVSELGEIGSAVSLLSLTALSCAALNGVPEDIVRRAEDLILLSIKGENLVAACCQMPTDEAAELEEAVS